MEMSTNILKWYPFKEGATVLEIYNENSLLEQLEKNIQIDKCNINEFEIKGKYDYITLIGTYEYASTIIKNSNPYSEILKKLKEHLKENGKIILAIDNRLGIKYFAGDKNEHYSRIFEGIESKIRKDVPNLLLKTEIEKNIEKAGFCQYKFYYPLPDYKNTSTIFTDEFLPKSNHSKIVYPENYSKEGIIVYNEVNVIKQICDIGQFQNFTNSYLVEIFDGERDNDIKFINYNVFRKDKYKLILTIKENSVQKVAETNLAKSHIEQINKNIKRLKEIGLNISEEVQNNKIVSEFINGEELDKKIVNEIKKGNVGNAYKEIEDWYRYISEKLETSRDTDIDIFSKYNIEVEEKLKAKMKFIKDGFIDLSFENVFLKEGYLFYDQEWCFENIPLEFILYRAINNLYTYNDSELEEKLKKKDILNRFYLTDFISVFEKLEKSIQDEILNDKYIEEYRNKIANNYANIKEIDILRKENSKKEEELIKTIEQFNILKNQKENIEDEHRKLLNEYNILLNDYNTSRGWKIIKGFRKFLGRG